MTEEYKKRTIFPTLWRELGSMSTRREYEQDVGSTSEDVGSGRILDEKDEKYLFKKDKKAP